jgi:hypothetical protein
MNTPAILRPGLIGLALALALSAPLGAEPTVSIVAPELKDGMAGLQAMLDDAVTGFSGDLSDMVSATLNKPLLMAGFNGAASSVALIPAVAPDANGPWLSLGSAASVYSQGLSTEILSQLDTLDATSDFGVGLCVQPLVVRGGLPLSFLLRGLTVGADIGYMSAETGEYGIRSFTAGVTVGYAAFSPTRGAIAWEGLRLNAGADYAVNRLSLIVAPGVISQVVPIDADGPGPLVPFYTTISLDPEIRAGVESTLLAFRAQASTGVSFFEALNLFATVGVTGGSVSSAISVDVDEEIEVSGYLGNLIETPGRVTIGGTTNAVGSAYLSPYFAGGLGFRVAFFDIMVPVLLVPFDSVGTGVFIGVRF